MKDFIKKNRFILIFGLNFILLVLTVHCISYNLTYTTGAIYNYSELQEGDIIPFGSQIKLDDFVSNDYVYSYAYLGANYISKININYCDDEDCLSDWDFGSSVQLSSSATHNVSTYKDIYGKDNDEYVGWEVRFAKDYSGDRCTYVGYSYECITNHYGEMVLVPTKNDEVECLSDLENLTSKWYTYSDDFEVKIDDTINDNFKKVDDGYLFIRKYNSYNQPASITFSMDTKENDVFYFKLLGNFGSISRASTVLLNNEEISDVIQSIPYYSKEQIELPKSGKNILEFSFGDFITFSSSYLSGTVYTKIKDPMVLTYINSGEKLDTSNLNNGDRIIHIQKCDATNYVRETKSIYEKEQDKFDKVDKIENKEEINNPNTIDKGIINFLYLAGITLIFLVMLKLLKLKKC